MSSLLYLVLSLETFTLICCTQFPSLLLNCTHYIKTDYILTKYEVTTQIWGTSRNFHLFPVILEHTNETIVNTYVMDHLTGILVVTYNNPLNYHRIYGRHQICVVGRVYSHWLHDKQAEKQKQTHVQIEMGILQIFAAKLRPQVIFFENVNFGITKRLQFPFIHRLYANSIFIIFNSGHGANRVGSIVRFIYGYKGLAKNLVGPDISDVTSISQLKHLWRMENSNLRRRKVFFAYTLKHHKNSYCSLYKNKFGNGETKRMEKFVENDCIKSTLLERKNITRADLTAFSNSVIGFISSDIPMHSDVSNGLKQSQSSIQWVIHGVGMETYGFSIHTDSKGEISAANFSAFVLPFDVMTWICILVSILTISICTIKISNSFTRSILYIVSTVLDQSDLISHKQRLSNYDMTPLLAAWIMVAMFLGFFYKGALFSYMTSKPVLNVPSTLEGLLKSNISIISITFVLTFLNHDPISPLDIITKDLVKILDPNMSLYDITVQLRNRVMYVPAFYKVVEIAENISTSKPVETCWDPNQSRCSDGNRTEIMIPKTFAVMSTKIDMRAFSNYMKQFSGLTEVTNTSPHPISYKVPWIALYNCFYNVFSRHMSSLVESGIYSWWRKNSNVARQVRDLLKNEERNNRSENVAFVQRLWVTEDVDHDLGERMGIDLQGVSLSTLTAPFTITLIFSGVAVFVFFVEILTRFAKVLKI